MTGEPVPDTLRLPRSLAEGMLESARAGAPNEVVGVAGGVPGEVRRIWPLTNTAASPVRYGVDPVEQMEAYRAMADENLECVAIYHSHPATPARPSAVDIAEAYDPDVAYVILTLAEGEEPVRAFRIADGAVSEIDVELT